VVKNRFRVEAAVVRDYHASAMTDMAEPVTKPRFLIALVLFSIGWLAMLPQAPLVFQIVSPVCFFLFLLVGMPRTALHRKVPPRELLLLAIVLLLFIAAAVASKVFLPEGTNQRIDTVLRRPLILIPLWALFVGVAFALRRRQIGARGLQGVREFGKATAEVAREIRDNDDDQGPHPA
jgi:hypothetical protein